MPTPARPSILVYPLAAAAATFLLLSIVGYDFLLTVSGFDHSTDRARIKLFWAGFVGIAVYMFRARRSRRNL